MYISGGRDLSNTLLRGVLKTVVLSQRKEQLDEKATNPHPRDELRHPTADGIDCSLSSQQRCGMRKGAHLGKANGLL